MARIGDIYLGGKNLNSKGQNYISSILFFLRKDSLFDFLYKPDAHWEIELKKGYSVIVARIDKPLNYQEVISNGMEKVQQCLDRICIRNRAVYSLDKPGSQYIVLYTEKGKSILQHFSIENISFEMSVTMETRDLNGNIIPEPEEKSSWHIAYRYYRLSQASNDIFEAYRNLFLAFESLLFELFPKQRSEKEVTWFRRVLSEIKKRISIDFLKSRNVTDPIESFIINQYKNIRCKLFHAKGFNNFLPHSEINPTTLTFAYENLIKLWDLTLEAFYSDRRGGGVITYMYFKNLHDHMFKNGFQFLFSNDNSPDSEENIEISPKKMTVYSFDTNKYLSETKLGLVTMKGTLKNIQQYNSFPIHRIAGEIDGNLFTVDSLEKPLFISDIDEFEKVHNFKLVNFNSAKIDF